MDKKRRAYYLLHTLWTKAATADPRPPDYDKREWQELEALIGYVPGHDWEER